MGSPRIRRRASAGSWCGSRSACRASAWCSFWCSVFEVLTLSCPQGRRAPRSATVPSAASGHQGVAPLAWKAYGRWPRRCRVAQAVPTAADRPSGAAEPADQPRRAGICRVRHVDEGPPLWSCQRGVGEIVEHDDIFNDAFVDAATVREGDLRSLPKPSRESMREVRREARRRRRAGRPARGKWATPALAVVVVAAAAVGVTQLVERPSGAAGSSPLTSAAGQQSPTPAATRASASSTPERPGLVIHTVGTCRFWDTRPVSNEVESKDHVVPCTQPHNSELVGVHTYRRPSQAYPGSAADYPYFETICRADVSSWMGPARPSWVKIGYAIPDIPQWEIGDRQFACFVIADPARPGSARNLGRT